MPGAVTPEGKAALWRRLASWAAAIVDGETRAQYLSDWRARFDARFPPPPPGLTEADMLPNGSVAARLTDQGPGVQALLKRVAAAWPDGQRDGVHDTKAAIGPPAGNGGGGKSVGWGKGGSGSVKHGGHR